MIQPDLYAEYKGDTIVKNREFSDSGYHISTCIHQVYKNRLMPRRIGRCLEKALKSSLLNSSSSLLVPNSVVGSRHTWHVPVSWFFHAGHGWILSERDIYPVCLDFLLVEMQGTKVCLIPPWSQDMCRCTM